MRTASASSRSISFCDSFQSFVKPVQFLLYRNEGVPRQGMAVLQLHSYLAQLCLRQHLRLSTSSELGCTLDLGPLPGGKSCHSTGQPVCESTGRVPIALLGIDHQL